MQSICVRAWSRSPTSNDGTYLHSTHVPGRARSGDNVLCCHCSLIEMATSPEADNRARHSVPTSSHFLPVFRQLPVIWIRTLVF
ncbi:hypothetical protein BaRGS_00002950 [Batillaria attramentaria]|uniref:Uncharacterized protein n=1 Tax=Batillaria attramentaria TaxID=370345 RepID=A0ABD0M1M2_9CAEN